MRRGAPTMIVLQEMKLDYQIDLTGPELADLARFIRDAEAQRNFQETDVPDLIRDWMVDEVYDEPDIEEMGQRTLTGNVAPPLKLAIAEGGSWRFSGHPIPLGTSRLNAMELVTAINRNCHMRQTAARY